MRFISEIGHIDVDMNARLPKVFLNEKPCQVTSATRRVVNAPGREDYLYVEVQVACSLGNLVVDELQGMLYDDTGLIATLIPLK